MRKSNRLVAPVTPSGEVPIVPRFGPTRSRRLLDPSTLAARWAAVALGVTVASGLWLRASLAWPQLTAGANVVFGIHAHSHAAFFGWLVLGVAALAARGVEWNERSTRQWRLIVHAIGWMSLVALVAFARIGYAAPTIALSAVHVLLWIPLARLAWPAQLATAAERAWWRAAWIALLASGAATLIPGVLAARDIREGWWREFGIKLFLSIFLNGFAGMAAMGLVLSRVDRKVDARLVTLTRRALGASLIPLAVLYVAAPPPISWMVWIGRAAVGITGISTLAVVAMSWRRDVSPAMHASLLAMTACGVLETIAASGAGAELLHSRPITIAFTHLLLLLTISPIFALSLTIPRVPVVRSLLAATGAATMCAAVAAFGWPWLGAQATGVGLSPMVLLKVAAVGGTVAAVAWWALLPLLFGARAPEAFE
jgi:hypothetical protein